MINEKEILSQLKNPEIKDKAFNYLVNAYSQKLYYHIRRMVIDHDDANDLLQDTFVNAFVNVEKFRSDSAIYTWLYKIATNTSLNFIAKKKRQYTFSAINYEDNLISKLESDQYFDGDALQKKLQQSILRLPTKQRLVFNMKYYDEMKYDEISKVLDTSVGGLKASYHHAVKKIEKYINED